MQQKTKIRVYRNIFAAPQATQIFNPYTLGILAFGAPQKLSLSGGRPETTGGPVPVPSRPPFSGGVGYPDLQINNLQSPNFALTKIISFIAKTCLSSLGGILKL